MKWLYYIQQRCSITSTECAALLCIIGLFFVGQIAQAVRNAQVPFDESYYAELDDRFRQGVAVLRGEITPLEAAQHAGGGDGPSAEAVAPVQHTQTAGQDTTRRRPRAETPVGRMNLNTATSAQLQRLPGIGPALAGRIIEYRNEHGPFKSVAEITKVRGIGPKTLENIQPFLFVDAEE